MIICCYNSSQRLPETLRKIASLNTDGIEVEVIVVNNASKDNTVEVAETEWARHRSNLAFRIENQSIPGLAAARSKGVAASNHKYILFCDDDNWLDRNYLLYALELMQAHPEVGALGGVSHPACEVTAPPWFNALQAAYAVGRQGRSSGEVWVLWGAGLVLRKDALQSLRAAGFQELLSDRKGNNLSSGGDHELCWALRLAGYKLWYDERLELQHFVPKDRLTEMYIRRLFRSTAYCVLGLQPYQSILERDIRTNESINRTIFWRKAARLFVELAKDSARLVPFRAIIQNDLPRKLDLSRRLDNRWAVQTEIPYAVGLG